MTPAERLSKTVTRRKVKNGTGGRVAKFACNLGDRRAALRLTMREVADAIGSSSAVICTIEHGIDPQLTTAMKLADFYGVKDLREIWTPLPQPKGKP